MTGRTDAIASASKASKKVATPTMIRALTCHHEVGRRSSRATMSSTDERVPAPSMFASRGFFDLFEGVVGGEHDAVVAERIDRAVQRLGGAHARGRHYHVLFHVFRRALGELDRIEVRPGTAVETPEQERQGFAQMAEPEPRAREAIE